MAIFQSEYIKIIISSVVVLNSRKFNYQKYIELMFIKPDERSNGLGKAVHNAVKEFL